MVLAERCPNVRSRSPGIQKPVSKSELWQSPLLARLGQRMGRSASSGGRAATVAPSAVKVAPLATMYADFVPSSGSLLSRLEARRLATPLFPPLPKEGETFERLPEECEASPPISISSLAEILGFDEGAEDVEPAKPSSPSAAEDPPSPKRTECKPTSPIISGIQVAVSEGPLQTSMPQQFAPNSRKHLPSPQRMTCKPTSPIVPGIQVAVSEGTLQTSMPQQFAPNSRKHLLKVDTSSRCMVMPDLREKLQSSPCLPAAPPEVSPAIANVMQSSSQRLRSSSPRPICPRLTNISSSGGNAATWSLAPPAQPGVLGGFGLTAKLQRDAAIDSVNEWRCPPMRLEKDGAIKGVLFPPAAKPAQTRAFPVVKLPKARPSAAAAAKTAANLVEHALALVVPISKASQRSRSGARCADQQEFRVNEMQKSVQDFVVTAEKSCQEACADTTPSASTVALNISSCSREVWQRPDKKACTPPRAIGIDMPPDAQTVSQERSEKEVSVPLHQKSPVYDLSPVPTFETPVDAVHAGKIVLCPSPLRKRNLGIENSCLPDSESKVVNAAANSAVGVLESVSLLDCREEGKAFMDSLVSDRAMSEDSDAVSLADRHTGSAELTSSSTTSCRKALGREASDILVEPTLPLGMEKPWNDEEFAQNVHLRDGTQTAMMDGSLSTASLSLKSVKRQRVRSKSLERLRILRDLKRSSVGSRVGVAATGLIPTYQQPAAKQDRIPSKRLLVTSTQGVASDAAANANVSLTSMADGALRKYRIRSKSPACAPPRAIGIDMPPDAQAASHGRSEKETALPLQHKSPEYDLSPAFAFETPVDAVHAGKIVLCPSPLRKQNLGIENSCLPNAGYKVVNAAANSAVGILESVSLLDCRGEGKVFMDSLVPDRAMSDDSDAVSLADRHIGSAELTSSSTTSCRKALGREASDILVEPTLPLGMEKPLNDEEFAQNVHMRDGTQSAKMDGSLLIASVSLRSAKRQRLRSKSLKRLRILRDFKRSCVGSRVCAAATVLIPTHQQLAAKQDRIPSKRLLVTSTQGVASDAAANANVSLTSMADGASRKYRKRSKSPACALTQSHPLAPLQIFLPTGPTSNNPDPEAQHYRIRSKSPSLTLTKRFVTDSQGNLPQTLPESSLRRLRLRSKSPSCVFPRAPAADAPADDVPEESLPAITACVVEDFRLRCKAPAQAACAHQRLRIRTKSPVVAFAEVGGHQRLRIRTKSPVVACAEVGGHGDRLESQVHQQSKTVSILNLADCAQTIAEVLADAKKAVKCARRMSPEQLASSSPRSVSSWSSCESLSPTSLSSCFSFEDVGPRTPASATKTEQHWSLAWDRARRLSVEARTPQSTRMQKASSADRCKTPTAKHGQGKSRASPGGNQGAPTLRQGKNIPGTQCALNGNNPRKGGRHAQEKADDRRQTRNPRFLKSGHPGTKCNDKKTTHGVSGSKHARSEKQNVQKKGRK